MTHDHDCTSLSPEEDIQIARAALAEGDHPHAAFHVAMALSDNPAVNEWLDLFDHIVAVAPDPDLLLPLEEGNAFYGTAAGRARVLARTGQTTLGLELLLQVMGAVPHLPFEGWAVDWLGDVHDTDELPQLTLGRLMATICYSTIGRLGVREAERAQLSRFVPILERFAAHPSAAAQPVVMALGSGILRRVGKTQEAVALAGQSLAAPTTFGYSAMGLARRAAGEFDEAVEAFKAAESLEPADPSYPSEQGRALWEGGRFAEAAAAFARSLERGEGDNEAAMSHDYTAHKAGLPTQDDPAWLFRWLGDSAGPDDIRHLVTPVIGWMPEPTEATVNVMGQLWDEYGADAVEQDFSFALSALEPPSALLSMAHWVTGSSDVAASRVTIEKVQFPDPRRAFGDGPLPDGEHVWTYDETVARQTVGPAPDEVGAAIASVATPPYYLPTWWAAARGVALQLGHHSDETLLGSMVHPPPRDPAVPPWLWVYYHQLAAALVIGRLDEPWSGGRRHRLLMGLACGPTDWTVSAAILALSQIALEEPDATNDIAAFFEALRERIPTNQDCCFTEMLCHGYLLLPCRPGHERAEFEALLATAQDEGEA